MRHSHLYIVTIVLLCAISALASGSPNRQHADNVPDISDRILGGIDSSKVDSTVALEPADLHRRTLVSDMDSDSVAEVFNPDEVPQSTRKSRIVRQKVDLDNVVNFASKDSMILIGRNSAYMYGDAELTYGDMKLTAAEVSMDMATNNVHAVGRPDSLGELTGTPIFTDKSGEYESQTMNYNFKSQRGFITDVITEQGEGYLTGGQTKKMESGEYYLRNGRYSTCSDHEHPHFYFQLTKAKVTPKSNIVTGPAYMVLAGLPLPLAVPFGYFPFSEKYSSGIIFPTFGDDYNRGFYLSNGGYYFAINDNIDLALTGELYTKGSWGLSAQSSYVKRYKYSGSFNISYLNTIYGEKGSPDYSKQTNFQILWNHSQDTKANPNMNLSASVNFTTSGYTRNDLNSYYSNSFTENTKSSTVNMTYRIPNSKWSFSTTANIAQRTQDSTLAVSFPNLTVTMSQVYPFKRKRAVGKERWYEKIKLSYSGLFQNSLTANQDEFFQKSLIKDWRNGMKHSIPISATFNMFKYINVTPSLRIDDRMYTSKVKRQWDPNASAEVMDTTYGFYNVWDFQASVSLDTKLYGFYQPMKFLGDKVKMIRHVLTPSISLSGAPDFASPFFGYYDQYQYQNSAGETVTKKYSMFPNALFGVPGQGRSGILSVSLANNLEMKVKSNDSIGEKKISLIENLSISQSYNFAADSMNWSNINTSLLLRLVKNFNLNLSATWDVYTYQLNSAGNPVRVNIPRWKAGKGIGRLSSTGTSFSYTFNNNTFKKKDKKDRNKNSGDSDNERDENDYDDEGDNFSGRNTARRRDEEDRQMEVGDGGYMKWEVPWSLTFNYSINYGYGEFNKKKMEYDPRITQNLSLSGNIQPTKNWNLGFSASYNFDTHKLAYMNCNISRDLHCFTMTASFVPVGPYKSYNFHISVKSSLLQDLKYDKRSSQSNGVDWY
ncbi:MAG TPA: putative LPS assembly protein LptD [Muribaculum sp.]|uniref:putative LPS assembly protein LptD n=1 Tax=Heminiphilus faecis TaxID=2601703 RepID=UPI000EF5B777|nr:putative LPS assembly protein LptD [Heminiphilus faecis]RLT77391.1 LPS-assembly protein LptD [bacterium J10(2018)]HRF69069.1 putative LPS assembly protein LptD [Muribaculum sp.]